MVPQLVNVFPAVSNHKVHCCVHNNVQHVLLTRPFNTHLPKVAAETSALLLRFRGVLGSYSARRPANITEGNGTTVP
jgi:hypothetical protein